MNYRSLAGNIGVAVLSQGVSLIASFATSLLVPKVLGVEEYSYWQLFIFYTSYSGFFALGLGDGIYLINGGKQRDEVDKRKIHSQLAVGIVMEVIFAAAVFIGASFLVNDPKRLFVIASTCIYLVISFVLGALGLLLQALNETKKYSYSILIFRLVFLIPMLLLLLFDYKEFEPFIIFYIAAAAVATVYVCYFTRDFIAVKGLPIDESIRYAINSMRVGITLMLSNIASMFIIGVLRACVDAKWGIEAFGQLSISLSLTNFALTFINQVGMVLFPSLRQTGEAELARLFRSIRDLLAFTMPLFYVLVFPAIWVLAWWLPAYASSLKTLIWLMPICIFDAQMSILVSTYLKVLRGEKDLLKINLFALGTSSVGVILGIWVFDSFALAVGSAVFAIVLRFMLGEYVVSKKMNIGQNAVLLIAETTITIVYLLFNRLLPDSSALVCTGLAYLIFLFLFRNRWAPFFLHMKELGRQD